MEVERQKLTKRSNAESNDGSRLQVGHIEEGNSTWIAQQHCKDSFLAGPPQLLDDTVSKSFRVTLPFRRTSRNDRPVMSVLTISMLVREASRYDLSSCKMQRQ